MLGISSSFSAVFSVPCSRRLELSHDGIDSSFTVLKSQMQGFTVFQCLTDRIDMALKDMR